MYRLEPRPVPKVTQSAPWVSVEREFQTALQTSLSLMLLFFVNAIYWLPPEGATSGDTPRSTLASATVTDQASVLCGDRPCRGPRSLPLTSPCPAACCVMSDVTLWYCTVTSGSAPRLPES